jgi:hypothetical protein
MLSDSFVYDAARCFAHGVAHGVAHGGSIAVF